MPVTSTRRFISLFISPGFPVSRYVRCPEMPAAPLPLEAPTSEPVLLEEPLAVGLPVDPPALPEADGDPVPLRGCELPVAEPDIADPLLDTFVRMNSASPRFAAPV
jgi:hypothetical protein